MRTSEKKNSGNNKLLKLQFASILTGVAITISSISLVLYKQDNCNSKQAKQVRQSIIYPSKPVLKTADRNIVNSVFKYHNIKYSAKLTQSKELKAIIDQVVISVKDKQFSLKPLSISIIDLTTNEYAGYQQEKFSYPASVVKLFWMVYLYTQIEKGTLSEADFTEYLDDMIKKSDNEAASYIVDKMSKTEYKTSIQAEEYKDWQKKRLQINKFFQQAGYEKINVSQKTFPIPNLKLDKPKGSELKLRDSSQNYQKTIRNQISTKQVAKLLYEIYQEKTISVNYSQKMAKLLTIDSQTRNIKKDDKNTDEFNSVRGFLSEDLPNDIRFMGKAGWTTESRNDAAIITTPDKKTAYILVVFANDNSYADDWEIFPQISHLVFEQMSKK